MKTIIYTIAIILTATLFANSQTTVSYTYDNQNRLTQVEYGNGSSVVYTYDELGNRNTKIITISDFVVSASSNPIVGGNTSGAGNYNSGETANLLATAAAGYDFVNWTEGGAQVSTNPNYSFTVTENRTLVANFEIQNYTITASANPSNGGSVSGDGNYDYGQTANLTATAETGYSFVNWTENGSEVSIDANYSFTVTEDRILIANFTEIQQDYLSLSTNTMLFTNDAGSLPLDIESNIEWTITCSEPWLSAFETTGVGNANNSVLVTENTGAERTGIVTVSGAGVISQEILVTQIGGDTTGLYLTNAPDPGKIWYGDFNNDGYADMLTRHYYDANITLFINNGDGTFGNAIDIETRPGVREFTIADFNNDNNLDFACTNAYSSGASPHNEMSVYLGNGDGTFQPYDNYTCYGSFTYTLYAGDVNNDNYADLVISSAGWDGFSVMINDGDGTFTEGNHYSSATEASYIHLLDVDEDNNLDVALSCGRYGSGTELEIFNGNGDGTFNAATVYPSPISYTRPMIIGFDDINNSTGLDIVTSFTDSNDLIGTYSYVNNGSGVFTENLIQLDYAAIELTDYDSDGNTDIIAKHYNSTESIWEGLYVLYGDGQGNFSEPEYISDKYDSYFHELNNNNLVDYGYVETNGIGIVLRGDYNIVLNANPSNGGVLSGEGEYNHNETANLTATPETGYDFVNWTEGGTQVSTDANYSFTVTANRTLVANFEIQNYTITATANLTNGGTVNGDGNYDYGQTANLTATPETGYDFVNWTEGGTQVSTNPNYSFTVTGNRTLVANFEIQNYTITASTNPTNGGTVSGDGNYDYGQTANLTATPETGYDFVNWTEGGTQVSTNPNYSLTVTGNRTLVANFEIQNYTVTASANPTNGGTVSGDGNYDYGQTANLTATPETGYDFVNWTEGGTQVSTNPNYSFTVTENRTLVANFEIQNYTVTASANPTNGGTVSGDGNYDYGQTANLTATPETGYDFVNWTEGGTQVSTNPNYSFTVTENRTLVANFEIQNYTIAASANPTNGGTVSGDGNYDYGQTANLTAASETGYDFVNWTEGGTQVSTNPNYSFTVTENRTLVANFEYTTEMLQVSFSNIIQVYPNPVSNELIIEFKGNNNRINFEILNSIGQVISIGSLVDKTIVETSNFPPGVYLIKLELSSTFEYRKIIKK